MQLVINGLTATFAEAELSRLVLERLQGTASAVAASEPSSLTPPAIGQVWPGQGGIYAGIVAAEVAGLERDYYLIVGPELDAAAHGDQVAAAKACSADGFTDWDLPFRKEQRIQFCNVQSAFKAEYYWSKEQHASNSNDAWLQHFNYGNQIIWLKVGELRARAVRRLTI